MYERVFSAAVGGGGAIKACAFFLACIEGASNKVAPRACADVA